MPENSRPSVAAVGRGVDRQAPEPARRRRPEYERLEGFIGRWMTDGTWRWQGETTCCTALFSDDGKMQTAHHERLDDAGWVPSMTVKLKKVE